MRALSPLLLLSLCACAASGLTAFRSHAWKGALDADHPLVGVVWDVKAGVALDGPELDARLGAARFVMLGEKHDNPDHHTLQGALVRRIVLQGRKPVLVFEMIAEDRQDEIAAASVASGWDPAAVAEASQWADSGWPPFAEYRPIFEAASEAGLSLVAAGLPRREAMALARGTKELEADVQARHALGSPLPEPLSSSLNQDLVASHCGYLTEETVAPMARVQRARDARMADAMLAAEGPAVLIAGGEHARPDRGVPWYIRRHSPEVTLAVRFIEVDAEKPKPTDYAERNSGGFDIFVFTPRLRDIDYCAELKAKGF